MNSDKNGFTIKELKLWAATAETHRPKAPTVADSLLAPMVQSFSASATRRGMLVTLTMDNSQNVTLNLNASICSGMVKVVAAAGHKMEWLQRDGTPKPNQ